MAKSIFEKMGSIQEVNRMAGELRRLGMKEKLKELDKESLEKLFGPSGTFTEKIAFLGERVADNAGANALSYSSKYNASGNSYAAFGSKYDIWG